MSQTLRNLGHGDTLKVILIGQIWTVPLHFLERECHSKAPLDRGLVPTFSPYRHRKVWILCVHSQQERPLLGKDSYKDFTQISL